MNRIFAALAIAVALLVASCGFFGNTAEVREQQSGKAVFKSADENQIDNPTITPAPQKVPGE